MMARGPKASPLMVFVNKVLLEHKRSSCLHIINGCKRDCLAQSKLVLSGTQQKTFAKRCCSVCFTCLNDSSGYSLFPMRKLSHRELIELMQCAQNPTAYQGARARARVQLSLAASDCASYYCVYSGFSSPPSLLPALKSYSRSHNNSTAFLTYRVGIYQ